MTICKLTSSCGENMKSLDTGKDKVKKICEVLKKETIDPAKQRAEELLEDARREADHIIQKAKQEAKNMHSDATAKIQEERNVFQASLNLAAKQSLLSLKQDIQNRLFNSELEAVVQKNLKDPSVIAKMLSAMIEALEKEGVQGDLGAAVGRGVSASEVNALLAKNILDKLSEKSVQVGDFAGGAQVKVHERKLTLDMSDEALKNLMANFLRDDFRTILFADE